MEELEEVLKREEVAAFHQRTPEQIEQIVDALTTVSEFVAGQGSVNVVVEDHDDDKFLAVALEGRADYIISGDRHLFGLGRFQGIPILLPRAFVDTVL
jgi:putative PIN family toxin of toxin-antitoxin system